MNGRETKRPNSRQLKSFSIKDILEFPDQKSNCENINFKQSLESDKNKRKLEEKEGNFKGYSDILKTRRSSRKMNSKSRKIKQTRNHSSFEQEQRNVLEKRFEKAKYISQSERRRIAKEIELSEQQVKTWFQNRRTRWRKAHGEKDLSKGLSILNKSKSANAQRILSNFNEKLSPAYVRRLHEQLTKR